MGCGCERYCCLVYEEVGDETGEAFGSQTKEAKKELSTSFTCNFLGATDAPLENTTSCGKHRLRVDPHHDAYRGRQSM